MAGPEDEKKPDQSVGASMREAQPYVDASWQFVGAVAVLTFAGYWADKHFGTKPWLMVAGCVVGVVVGMWTFLRVVLSLDRQRKAREAKDRR